VVGQTTARTALGQQTRKIGQMTKPGLISL